MTVWCCHWKQYCLLTSCWLRLPSQLLWIHTCTTCRIFFKGFFQSVWRLTKPESHMHVHAHTYVYLYVFIYKHTYIHIYPLVLWWKCAATFKLKVLLLCVLLVNTIAEASLSDSFCWPNSEMLVIDGQCFEVLPFIQFKKSATCLKIVMTSL